VPKQTHRDACAHANHSLHDVVAFQRGDLLPSRPVFVLVDFKLHSEITGARDCRQLIVLGHKHAGVAVCELCAQGAHQLFRL